MATTETEEYTGVGVFLIPESSDPIVAASSEPAHLTTIWLGDMNDLDEETISAIRGEVAAYAAELDGPVVVPVTERGTLGDEDADVVFLERTESLLALREGFLEASPTTRRVMDSVEQFPEWTPHVTLGYPETPAAGGYDGAAVTFNAVGLWVGPEQEEFAMGKEQVRAGGAIHTNPPVVIDPEHSIPKHVVERLNLSPERITRLSTIAASERSAAFDMAAVIADVDDSGLPVDELDDDEEEITEIPVHGVATIEGRATGDGRGFRLEALDLGSMPQPLGYEYTSTHGGSTSNVAIVGRIDSYERKLLEDGTSELRWRGVIMPGKEYGARAIESILDGSYTGLSVIVDSIEVDVADQREEMRRRLSSQSEEVLSNGEAMSDAEIEAMIDEYIGDGTQPVTWFSSARVRRFDMVPTGAFQEAYIALGHEFADEMTPEQIEASAAALADCGCAESQEEAEAIIAAATGFAPGTKDGPGWITHPVATSRIRRYWVKGEGAAKIRWGVPGDFNRCRTQLAKYVQNPEWLAGLCANMHKEAIGVWPGQEGGDRHSLAASAEERAAAPLVVLADAGERTIYPASAFEAPREGRAFPLRIDRETRTIVGYAAQWGVCHIGIAGVCQEAPRSNTDYSYFRKGVVDTDAGEQRVGLITAGIGHAGERVSAASATAHYDQTQAVRAYINIGEDQYGIWFAGVIPPYVTDDEIDELRAIGRVSGDWRSWSGVRGDLEMVGLVAVNTEGFQLAASGGVQTAAIGIGALPREEEPAALTAAGEVERRGDLTADVIAGIAIAAAEQVLHSQKREALAAQAAPARAALKSQMLTAARNQLTKITKE